MLATNPPPAPAVPKGDKGMYAGTKSFEQTYHRIGGPFRAHISSPPMRGSMCSAHASRKDVDPQDFAKVGMRARSKVEITRIGNSRHYESPREFHATIKSQVLG
jgi:hypothetical protein